MLGSATTLSASREKAVALQSSDTGASTHVQRVATRWHGAFVQRLNHELTDKKQYWIVHTGQHDQRVSVYVF